MNITDWTSSIMMPMTVSNLEGLAQGTAASITK